MSAVPVHKRVLPSASVPPELNESFPPGARFQRCGAGAYFVAGQPVSYLELRQTALETLPRRDAGLRIDCIKEFFLRYGHSIGEYCIVDRSDRELVQQVLGSFAAQFYATGWRGVHSPELRLVLVERDRQLEELNSPEFSEATLVHELAHAGGLLPGVRAEVPEPGALRVGVQRHGFSFFDRPRGAYLEEGFVELMTGCYLAQFGSGAMLTAARSALGAPASLGPEQFVSCRDDSSGIVVPIPLRYFYAERNGSAELTLAAVAAAGLELLCLKEPELFTTLLQARVAPLALRRIPALINGMEPGLYAALQKIGTDQSDIYAGTRLILDRVYEGRTPQRGLILTI